MLNLARRFADKNLRSGKYTYSDQGQAIPCEWWDSEGDESEEEEEEVDDYGISIGGIPERDDVSNRRRRMSRRRRDDDDGWDLD